MDFYCSFVQHFPILQPHACQLQLCLRSSFATGTPIRDRCFGCTALHCLVVLTNNIDCVCLHLCCIGQSHPTTSHTYICYAQAKCDSILDAATAARDLATAICVAESTRDPVPLSAAIDSFEASKPTSTSTSTSTSTRVASKDPRVTNARQFVKVLRDEPIVADLKKRLEAAWDDCDELEAVVTEFAVQPEDQGVCVRLLTTLCLLCFVVWWRLFFGGGGYLYHCRHIGCVL